MGDSQRLSLIEKHLVPLLEKPQRLSDYLPGIFKAINSRKGIKKAIKKEMVRVNNKTGHTGNWIKGGEIIALYQENKINKNLLTEIPIHVFYEDNFLAVVRKPAGITVSGNKKRALEHALPGILKTGTQSDALLMPQVIHRLDYPTSGVLLVGKTIHTVSALNRLFEERKIEKKYIAVTIGKMLQKGTIETKIDNKKAKTVFRVLTTVDSKRFEHLNLVDIDIETGRKHQIRKHMAGIGNPVLGDQTYGTEEKILKGKGVYLHAISLKFKHPLTNEIIEVRDEAPLKFKKIFPDFL